MGTWVHQIGHILIILVLMDFSNCSGICKEEEMRALLCFKNELEDPMNRLTSWVDGVDCCTKWEGVVCHNGTGHVVQLQLPNPNYDFEFVSLPKGKLSPCLLELKQLRHLDLSGLYKYFSGSRIPNFIGSFANLEYLDLSHLGFQGIIPHQLGNLTSLHTLRLSCYGLKADTLDWLFNLSNLELLDLSDANLSMAHNWAEVINMLPSLRELHLSSCDLPNLSHHPHRLINNSLLEVLDLSGNEFNSVIPRWMFNLNNLVSLDLSSCGIVSPFPDGPWNLTSLTTLNIIGNELNGSFPRQLFGLSHLISLNIGSSQFQDPLPIGLSNLTSLKNLVAFGNHMNSHIPNWIYDLTNLESLVLWHNQLQGSISNSISKLTSLSTLDLSDNMLTGELPKQIGKLSKLQVLFLYGNMLTGEIPKQIEKLSNLRELNLGRNKLCGPLPKSLGYSFPMMERLYLSNNKLEGTVTESNFVNLTKLKTFGASVNRLSMSVSPNWTPPFQLDELDLGGWNLGPQFPAWLQSQHQISWVDISNAGIQSVVPGWFWNLSSQFQFLNLSHNQLRGQIPAILPLGKIQYSYVLVYLGSNQFNGPLPRISSQISELDLSNNSFSGDVSHFLCHVKNESYQLRILHLGGNGLFGKIPNCWMHWPYLEVINMGKNQLVGNIPNSIGFLDKLKSLDVHKNMLHGPIPPSLQNCTLLLKVDLAENGFTGKIPRWLGTSLSKLTIFTLRSNKFYGELPPEFCHLTSLRILDLSYNNLSGVIPWCLKNLTAMISEEEIPDEEFGMGYSQTAWGFGESAIVTTKGIEYEYYTIILLLFVSMDLSNNKFTGDIPIELTNLVRLKSLNFSRNKLTGNIPMEMGNMKLLESLDLSRNQLSGKIPSSLSSLYTLGVLDLSYNNLSGKIPSGTQLQGFNASCYVGNNLCGPPVSKNCSIGDGEIPKKESEGDDDDSSEVEWFYVSMAIGFAVGLWGFCGSLLVVRPWRIAYFGFLDNKLKSFLVWAHVLSA